MKDRHYRTEAGSRARTFGKHGRAWCIDFDWLEEGVPFGSNVQWDEDENAIRWESEDGEQSGVIPCKEVEE